MPLIHFTEREFLLFQPGESEAADRTAADPESLASIAKSFASGPDHDMSVLYTGRAPWQSAFTVLRTGGGLVINGSGEILLIRRLGKWDLPKGKLDEGETTEAAAVREVEEETGVSPLALQRPLLITYHTYSHEGELILKENFWYLMRTSYSGALTPQTEEDIEACTWADPAALEPYWDEMYPAVRDVIAASGLMP